jgi:protein-S-isoprenylcysteine O-methyltransferase Ste14
VLFFIPDLSGYLKQKYGEQYEERAQRTKRLVPFVW